MSPKFLVHKTAEVDPAASVGLRTKIWHQSQIMPDANIGTDCILGKCVFVDRGVRVGNRVKIQNGVSVYSGVTIEDDCFLGPHMVFTNDLVPRAFVHDFEVTPTLVKRGTSIGANATIVCGVTLGEFSMIGAGSVVTKDVPPYTLVFGNPAHIVSTICRCGNRTESSELENKIPQCVVCEK